MQIYLQHGGTLAGKSFHQLVLEWKELGLLALEPSLIDHFLKEPSGKEYFLFIRVSEGTHSGIICSSVSKSPQLHFDHDIASNVYSSRIINPQP